MIVTARVSAKVRKYRWATGGIFGIALILVSLPAQSVSCAFTNLFNENLTIPVVGPGMSTVGEDVPIGKVLYKARFMGNGRNTGYACTITEVEDIDDPTKTTMQTYNRVEVIAMPAGAPTRSGEKDIFPTNVPGIGAIFYISGSLHDNAAFPGVWERTMEIGFGTITQGLGQVNLVAIELVKTGPIPPGTQQVLGSSFPTFQSTSGSTSPMPIDHVFVTLNFSGAMTVYAKTCQLATSTIDVNLGTHQQAEFTGVGFATAWKGFDITLSDCPAFTGYGDYLFRENNGTTTGSNTPNRVVIGFNSIHGVVESNPQLAKLENRPDAAQGIGIELSERGIDESINLEGAGGFELQNLPTADGSTYVIPLKARYVQYNANVKAGIANGAVVFTVTYN